MLVDFVTDKGVVTTPTTIPVVVGGSPLDAIPRPRSSTASRAQRCRRNIDNAFIVPGQHRAAPGRQHPQPRRRRVRLLRAHGHDRAPVRRCSSSSTPSSRRAAGVSSPRVRATATPQSLFQKAGNDGFYWELGITVNEVDAHHASLDLRRSIRTPTRSRRRRPIPFGHHRLVLAARPQRKVQRVDHVANARRGRHADQAEERRR